MYYQIGDLVIVKLLDVLGGEIPIGRVSLYMQTTIVFIGLQSGKIPDIWLLIFLYI